MAGKVLADLTGAITQATFLQQQRRLHRTGSQHHDIGIDVNIRHLDAVSTDHLSLNPHGPAAIFQNPGHPGIGMQTGTMGHGPGQIGNQHGLLAIGLAAGQTVTGQGTVADIALERFDRPTQLFRTIAHQTAVAGNLVFTVLFDRQVLFNPLEPRFHGFGAKVGQTKIATPFFKNKVRCAERYAAVHHGRATHAAALQQQQIAFLIGLAAKVFVQPLQTFVEILTELGRRHIGASLQNQHIQSLAGQLIGGHCATGAGTDHHHVGTHLVLAGSDITGLNHLQTMGRYGIHRVCYYVDTAHAEASSDSTGRGVLPSDGIPQRSDTGPSKRIGPQVAGSRQ